ncbi:TPA: hypothetical protein VYU04_001773 [Streptococcus pneumoniae]|uniref:Uncharacterized protein n=4 Tax=Streptococcus pneumoniae TaxID=1313 RepID=Q8CYY1_STRR6|nr:hypothetical protein [Streptococcus pneumoniae]EJG79718.1 putative membrane protein [Streptococcus pneumoniae SPAR27]AAK99546.1 Hypothetical protein spr0742 [Streptococcus pneumoniae R6]ABJ54674.1 membrane protein, putative [Streptococcus pneumoniae D39]AVN85869.1 Hypothetical protein SPV_0734 [Streptococcus pneumoniae]EHZ60047.1 putative membrane protein [Streptococcus pneumoniae GA47461]
MKILKRYILELCFILSFALPFIKGANADNGRCFVETYYGFTFLMEHAIVTAVFIYSFLIAFLLKKRWAKWIAAGSYCFLVLWIAAGSYCFLVLWIATEGYFFRMSLEDLIRLWTSLEILTQTYQLGFYLNILLGILLIIKYFKVKQ